MRFNFSPNICRICLENESYQSIYEKHDENLSINEKITLIADIKISDENKWPNKICETCLTELDISYKFGMKCKKSDDILAEIFINNVQFLSDSDTENSKSQQIESNSTNVEILECDKFEDHLENGGNHSGKDKPENVETSISEMSSNLEINSDTEESKPKSKSIIKKGRHASESLKPCHICEICGNAYQYKSSLETHVRRHTNEKPFSCEICGRSFVLNGQLACHMRTHTGEKPYECRFCKRRYADVGARQVHERTHTGERPFKCDICKKAFTYASVLKKHKLTHTDEKKYSCDHCGKKFRLRYHLTAHMNTTKHQQLAATISSINNEESSN